MAGVVTTQFHENNAFNLPQTSCMMLSCHQRNISSWANGDAKPKGGYANEFAESLFDDLVGNGKGSVVWGPTLVRLRLCSSGPRPL